MFLLVPLYLISVKDKNFALDNNLSTHNSISDIQRRGHIYRVDYKGGD